MTWTVPKFECPLHPPRPSGVLWMDSPRSMLMVPVFDYYKALRAVWLCVGPSGLLGARGCPAGRTPAPRAPPGRVVPGAAEAQALGRPREGQAAPVCGGATVLGASSALWVRAVVLQGSGEFWRPPIHPACSGSLGKVRTPNQCYRPSARVEPATPASSGDKDPCMEPKPDPRAFQRGSRTERIMPLGMYTGVTAGQTLFQMFQ